MTLDIRRIDERFAVAPQIAPEDLPAIAAAGFAVVINNRPDEEEPGQPEAEAIQAAAEAAGLVYHDIPVHSGGFWLPQLTATAQVMADAPGPVLAFCRSGTRSCSVWALSRARAGDDVQGLVDRAAAGGYDLSGLRSTLDDVAPRA